MTITVKDENFSGEILNNIALSFKSEIVTVKDIIAQRVLHEVENYNEKLPEYFNGLIKPSDAEKTINGYKLSSKKKIDGEKQVYTALNAFQKNGFFVLVNSLQVEDLHQQVELKPNTIVSFIKVTPLVGG